jgi:glycosyltransferase involved in cell wall biosynthesis
MTLSDDPTDPAVSQRRLRPLILSGNYLPDTSGTSLRISRLVTSARFQEECAPSIATIFPPSIRTGKNAPHECDEEVLDGVRVLRFRNEATLLLGLLRRRPGWVDVVHGRGPRMGFYARILGLRWRIPSLVELNYIFPQQSRLRRAVWRYALQSSNRIISLSEAAKDWLVNDLGICEKDIDVVVNGVDTASFAPQESLFDGVPTVGYVGTFFEWQGVMEFVRIAAEMKKSGVIARFVMVGDGPDLQTTRRLAVELDVADAIQFTGHVSPGDVPRQMARMDVILLPRPDRLLNRLAIPLKLSEAMAMGKCVVVTPVLGLTELIRNGENGLVAGFNTTDIARAVASLVVDARLRARLGDAAQRTICEGYTWERAAATLVSSYRLALDSKLSRMSKR